MENLLRKNHRTRSGFGLSVLFMLTFFLGSLQGIGQTWVSTSATVTVAATSIQIVKPSSLLAGHLMIAQIAQSSNNNINLSNVSSSGWNIVSGSQYYSTGNDRYHCTILYKIATSTDVAASNFTFNGADCDDMMGTIMAFSNSCQVSVVGAWGTAADVAAYSTPSITTLTANSLVIMFGAVANNGKPATDNSWAFAGSAMTERYDADYNATKDMGIAAASISRTSITTGVGSATILQEFNSSILIAISPSTIAGTLSGTQAICSNGTTTLTSSAFGGAWTSGTTGVATINSSTGLVTPVSAGTSTMTYTVSGTGGCSNATQTRTVTVTAAPSAGTLSGTQAICSNGTTTLSSSVSGGAWTSGTTGVATINSSTGVVTPVSAGTSTMAYTVTGTGGCSDATQTRTVTVTAPATAVTLSGTQAICSNGTTTFTTNGTSGGSWTS